MDSGRPSVPTDTFRVLCVYRAHPGHEAELEDALVAACTTIRNDAGLVGLTLLRSIEIRGGFQMLMRWEDRHALTESFLARQQEGLTETASVHCASIGFDVLVPCDPPGAQGPTPDRIGTFMVSRIAIPLPQHVDAARAVMDGRTRLVQSHPGCLWAMNNTHADRADFLHSCSGWDSRLAWEIACQELGLPNAWTDVIGMSDAVALDLLEPILELVPDRLMVTG